MIGHFTTNHPVLQHCCLLKMFYPYAKAQRCNMEDQHLSHYRRQVQSHIKDGNSAPSLTRSQEIQQEENHTYTYKRLWPYDHKCFKSFLNNLPLSKAE